METIDRKFQILAVNPCKGTIYTEKNAVLFAAKDLALVPALLKYQEECIRLGCGQEHIDSIHLLIERVMAFQGKESRIPDTDTDCEIRRCIGGEGV